MWETIENQVSQKLTLITIKNKNQYKSLHFSAAKTWKNKGNIEKVKCRKGKGRKRKRENKKEREREEKRNSLERDKIKKNKNWQEIKKKDLWIPLHKI